MSSVELKEMLSDAAFRGDVVALADLLAKDPNLLDKHHLKCEDKNALHLAAMLGNVEFFQAVLQANSSFCHDMCLARDRDGQNPIHLAASHGKMDILKLIKDDDWLVQAAMEKTDNGGTILHLCVKHNQLDALRLLLDIFSDPEFQKARNEDGMTILHLAFYYNQNQRRRKMIIFLIKDFSCIVNLKNANGKTAFDLFLREAGMGEFSVLSPYRFRRKSMREYDSEMTHSLLQANAKRGQDISYPSESSSGNRKNAIMVVASLIATMAFQAMISPPGGTWQDNSRKGDDNPHRVGESVMAQTHPILYRMLINASTIAFVSSLSIIILLVSGMSSRLSHFFPLSSIVLWPSVAAIAAVYSITLVAIVPESDDIASDVSSDDSDVSASRRIAFILLMVWILIIFAIIVELVKVCINFTSHRRRHHHRI